MTRLHVVLEFGAASPLHTAADRVELWADRVALRDWRGKVTFAATSIKGWLRDSAERALRGMGCLACEGCAASTACGECLVCRVFGHPRGKSPLRFTDVFLAEPLTGVRTQASLSRRRRTAYEERLFSTEVAWSRTLRAEIDGIFEDEVSAGEAAALLWVAAKSGFALGAARSRGLGWVRLDRISVTRDGREMTESELADAVSKWRRANSG